MKYPVLEPVPIRTKGLSLLMRIWVWLFSSRKWKLKEDWYYDTEINGGPVTVYIEKGFIFDGASTPRSLWWLLQPMGVLLIPGLIHDYAYRYQKLVICENKDDEHHYIVNCDRRFWDILFRSISIEVNGCKVISYCAWIALWIFGGLAWRTNRKLEIKRAKEAWKNFGDDSGEMQH